MAVVERLKRSLIIAFNGVRSDDVNLGVLKFCHNWWLLLISLVSFRW